jgi:hypothetical protein
MSPIILVPLPPFVTYRASMLPREKTGTVKRDFRYRVFDAEWVFLVFGVWCADVRKRRIMWRLPSRVRSGLAEIGVKPLKIETIRSLITRQQRGSNIPRGIEWRFPRQNFWVLRITQLMGRLTHVGSKQGAFHQKATCLETEMKSFGSTIYHYDSVIHNGTC